MSQRPDVVMRNLDWADGGASGLSRFTVPPAAAVQPFTIIAVPR